MKRSITIEATGCHDCQMVYTERCGLKLCELTGKYVNSRDDNYYQQGTFHPDCPMQEVEQ